MEIYNIVESENGEVLLQDGLGCYAEPKRMEEIANGLLLASKKSGKYIPDHNKEVLKSIYKESEKHIETKVESALKKRHVYLLKCGDKYKIGVSKNVTRRVKELDNKPFKVEVVAKSPKSIYALYHEAFLHEKYDKKRVWGEWFKLTQKDVDFIIDYYSKIGGEND